MTATMLTAILLLMQVATSEPRIVFMGDSITQGWKLPKPNYINRGISSETTPQMLVRFRRDVIALKPAAVVILGGINDIAGNTGPSTPEMIEDNLMSMTELARANGILNAWIKAFAARVGAVYLDYHSAMADERKGLRADLTADGVHPTEAGYRVMAPLAERAIAQALLQSAPR